MATKPGNGFLGFQVIFRFLAIAGTIAAAYLIITTTQTISLFGIQFSARYNYSSAYKFFAYANCAAAGLSFFTLMSVLLIRPGNYFIVFLHDLVVGMCLMAACAAATAFGFIGKYGNSHTGWSQICDKFAKYCDKVTYAVGASYAAVVFYFILTIMCAYKSNTPQ
ncbi:OLC1v1013727C1 [Oldenlandia corymbosa var. corymbosa]|uniref:CASP-like protein n=1 Tax=Oldenlandia corymbosa var. corymbosa TaxID=529605 RepID=A0AAV1E281_OLDCO|nr:OLC1v1013727C1 [Oldenlandia corymbosa var. corymbosa]